MTMCLYYSLREESSSRGGRAFLQKMPQVSESWEFIEVDVQKFINRRTNWKSAGDF